ncbi:IS481 family transposase ISGme9 [subsurface metagenome]|nr:transposase [Bacillota bacterium]
MKNEYRAMRQKAIQRYLAGEKPVHIYRDLDMSRKWLYKWLHRHNPEDLNWASDRSRARKTSSRVLSPATEARIVKIRKRLETHKYNQIGAINIQWYLSRLDVEPLPEIWQINRTLKRYNLTKPKGPYKPKNKVYPAVIPDKPGVMQQMDFTPSSYIEDFGITKGLNLIDVFSGRAKINICLSRKCQEVHKSLLSTWKTMGLSNYLQMDNDPVFIGHNQNPHYFSAVIRLILLVGIEPIFIPPYEPWRNGVIEKFQDEYKNIFFKSQRWTDLDHLIKEAGTFEDFHNHHHRYSTRQGKTPMEIERIYGYKPDLLPRSFKIPDFDKLNPVKKGKIHFIRFIRSDGILNIFGKKFRVIDGFLHEYVRATVDLGENKLTVYHPSGFSQELVYCTIKSKSKL